MPVLYTTLQETQKTILKSCFFSIIQDVVKETGIPHDTIVAMHHGVEVNRTDNRTNVSVNGVNNLPATVSQRRVIATITENYDEDSLTSTAVSQRETYPIFNDVDVDVCVYPVYVKTQVTIELEYSCGSKTEAQRLRDDIRVKLSQSRNILHHEVEYNILLPTEVEDFIADVYELKNRLFPQTLQEYFLTHATKRIHRITDMANAANARIAVHERQVRIVGVLDFSPEPSVVEQNSETNTYKLTIPYRFTLDVPRGMCMSYPPMVCNQLMPSKYLAFVEARKIKTREEYSRNIGATRSLGALSHFESHRQLTNRIQEKLPLNLPLFDEFHERVGHNGYVITTTFLTDVDETDRRSLLNLRELGDFQMDEKLLAFIAGVERRWIINPFMSPFYLGLHQKNKHYDNNILEIDAELNVRSKVDIPLIKPTRLALSVCLDTTCLNAAVMQRMYQHKDIYLLYLTELIRSITNYRSEFSRWTIAENAFYLGFVGILNDATNKDEHAFIREFMVIFSQDKKMMQILIGILLNNYPKFYKKLNLIMDIDKYRYSDFYKKDHTGVENFAMRTVMTVSVTADLIDARTPVVQL